MNEEDLKELLLSIAEEDAIIAQLYNFFILEKGYSIDILEQIIEYGISIGWFEIVNVNCTDKLETSIDWQTNNIFQEVLFSDMTIAISQLFQSSSEIPTTFRKFVLKK